MSWRMLSQLDCFKRILCGVNQPIFVTIRAALFWMTCAALMMNSSVPPQTGIMKTKVDMMFALATINQVLKLAFTDNLFRAFILGIKFLNKEFLLSLQCSVNFKDSCT